MLPYYSYCFFHLKQVHGATILLKPAEIALKVGGRGRGGLGSWVGVLTGQVCSRKEGSE